MPQSQRFSVSVLLQNPFQSPADGHAPGEAKVEVESELARQNGDQGGDPCYDLAAQFLPLAEKQKLKASRVLWHRLVSLSLVLCGSVAEGRVTFRSQHGSLRSRRRSCPGDAFAQTPGWQFYLSLHGLLAARLSRGRNRRLGVSRREFARLRTCSNSNVCIDPESVRRTPLRRLRNVSSVP